jgi:hypothetical protein
LFIPDPDTGFGSGLFTHPGSRIQGSKRHRIPEDPQPCSECRKKILYRFSLMIKVSKPEYDFFRKGSDPEQQNWFASSLVSIFKDALGRGCEG